MYVILLAIHFLISFVLVGLILIQHGKGAQAGAAFGSGASQTVFGSQGSGNFLSRMTSILAGLFFVLNLFLVYYLNKQYHPRMLEEVPAAVKEELPANKSESSPSTKPAGNDVPEI